MYKILDSKSERNRQLGRPRHRWDDNIKININEKESVGVDWINLAQDRVQWQAAQ
jgi:hypothetical protein